jgi:hypothetical protein
MTLPAVPTDTLADRLLGLRDAVSALRFDLSGPVAARLRPLRDRIADDIAGQAVRVRDFDAPLLAVFGGVTGAGKSTCLNSLVGQRIVKTGVLRPTTYAPTLVTSPQDAEAFSFGRVLPDLPRVSGLPDVPAGGESDSGVLRLLPAAPLSPGLALLDAPDIDSVSSSNRDLADQLLDAADLWLWFTSAGKYADEESMRYLRRARERNTALAIILTQVPSGDTAEVLDDFRDKLAAEGLGDVPVLVVPLTIVTDGRLPDETIAPLREWLAPLTDAEARLAMRRRTLQGALNALPGEVAPLLDAVGDEQRAARRLAEDAERTYDDVQVEFGDALEQGLPLREEVLSRWDRFVGGGQLLRVAERVGEQARTWLREALSGSGAAVERPLEREVRMEVGSTVTDLTLQLNDLAAAETADAWERLPAGADLLNRHPELRAAAQDLKERTEDEVRDWERTVAHLVETKGVERRSTARWASGAINAVATGGIVIAFAQTGGLTGAEAGIATAAGAANQALLVKLLGEANLRWLLARAREDLIARFQVLAEAERARYDMVLADAVPTDEEAGGIPEALAALQQAARW